MCSSNWNSVAVSSTSRPSTDDLHPRRVKHDGIAHAYDVIAHRRRLRTAQDGANPGDDLPGAEGLGDVVIRAELQPGDPIGLLGSRREHDDRDIAGTPHRPGDIEPVHARQGQIEDHQVGTVAREMLQRVLAVARGHDLETCALEVVANQADDRRFIVDDEHLGHCEFIVGGTMGRRTSAAPSLPGPVGQTDCGVAAGASVSDPLWAPAQPPPQAMPCGPKPRLFQPRGVSPSTRGSASAPRKVITMNPGFFVVTPTAVAAPMATRPQAVRPARSMSILQLEGLNGTCITLVGEM